MIEHRQTLADVAPRLARALAAERGQRIPAVRTPCRRPVVAHPVCRCGVPLTRAVRKDDRSA